MDTFTIVTTLIAIFIAALAAWLPLRLWLVDRKERSSRQEKRGDVKAFIYGEKTSNDLVLCVEKLAENQVSLVRLPITIANSGAEQIKDVIISVTIPEMIFPAWRKGDYELTGPVNVLSVEHHHALIEGKRIVSSLMKASFVNPRSAFEIEYDLLIRGSTRMDSVTKAMTKDNHEVEMGWHVQYHFEVRVDVIDSKGPQSSRNYKLHVIEYPAGAERESYVTESDMLKNILKPEEPGPPAKEATLVFFDRTEESAADEAEDGLKVFRLSGPVLRLSRVNARLTD